MKDEIRLSNVEWFLCFCSFFFRVVITVVVLGYMAEKGVIDDIVFSMGGLIAICGMCYIIHPIYLTIRRMLKK